MVRLGPAESPRVKRTLQRKQAVFRARSALSWGFLNLVLAVAMYYDMSFGTIVGYFNLVHPLIWYAECILAVIFTINTVVDVLRYILPSLSSKAVELNEEQMKLLGVKKSDLGFRTATPRQSVQNLSSDSFVMSSGGHSPSSYTGSSTPIQSPHYHPHAFSRRSPTSQSFQRSPSPSSSRVLGSSSHYSLSGAAGSYIASMGMNIPATMSPGYLNQSTSPGYLNQSTSPGYLNQSTSPGYLNQSTSPGYLNQSTSPVASSSLHSSYSANLSRSFNMSGSPLSLSPLFRENLDTSGLRNRLHLSAKASPMGADTSITDQKTLHKFLKEQEEKEMLSQLASPDQSSNAGHSFWNYNRTGLDYSPMLKKYHYQVACRSPQNTKSPEHDPDDPATYRADEVWSRLGVHRDALDRWVEDLRKWLGQTIMVRLVEEINFVNRNLARLGSEDMQIGEVSIGTLKQLAVTKSQHVPTLNTLVPFLEVCANQEYLVKRIRELGTGGCLSVFDWNGGGEFKGKPWEEHLPTDCEIVMHMLCTYMDSRLPPHPRYPDGKTFTSHHFLKSPDKPDLTKKEQLLLYQSKINPPHYKVIYNDDTWDLPKGRNNMFHGILLFLYHIKTKEHGMLGRINLGLSGINILWVIDEDL